MALCTRPAVYGTTTVVASLLCMCTKVCSLLCMCTKVCCSYTRTRVYFLSILVHNVSSFFSHGNMLPCLHDCHATQSTTPHTHRIQVALEAAALAARSRPFEDRELLMPVCPRCATANPVLSSQGDRCLNCGAEFVRCFASFRVLPLVAFETTVPADKVLYFRVLFCFHYILTPLDSKCVAGKNIFQKIGVVSISDTLPLCRLLTWWARATPQPLPWSTTRSDTTFPPHSYHYCSASSDSHPFLSYFYLISIPS